MKRCNKCQVEKELTDFHKMKASKDGLQAKCKTCITEVNNARRAANPQDSTRYTMNSRRKDRTAQRRAQRAYYDRYPWKTLASNRLKELRKSSRVPLWADIKAMEEIYRQRDIKAKATGEDLHVDHVIPLNGELVCGLHVPENLQIITGTENRTKHNHYSIN